MKSLEFRLRVKTLKSVETVFKNAKKHVEPSSTGMNQGSRIVDLMLQALLEQIQEHKEGNVDLFASRNRNQKMYSNMMVKFCVVKQKQFFLKEWKCCYST